MGLAELEARVRADLAMIAHPQKPWLQPKTYRGAPVLDVLIIGAGQGGLAASFALMRDQVTNILAVDAAEPGREGIWTRFARMPTLRSPKNQTGPDLNIPALTYQSWHSAKYGCESWDALRLIPTQHWQDYLNWFRRVTGVKVRNHVRINSLAPTQADDGAPLIAAGTATGETLLARRVILATGQDGTGAWWMPDFLQNLPKHLRAHAADDIDFAALKGRKIAVLGAGASAFDNAATALEAGAAEVHLFCRRAEPQLVQPYRWLTFAGFLRHIGEMDDAWRWRFLRHILALREGFPQDTWNRVAKFPNFHLHTGVAWHGAEGALRLHTSTGPFDADFAIAGTGIDHDCRLRPELAAFADNIATWADRYTPPEHERDDRLARFPYLAPDYAFTEREPGRTPWISAIHLFGIGATMSFGPSGSSLNAMTTAIPKLAAGITRGLFREDLQAHWADLQAYADKQAVLT
jgi:cation diffusion facilitator CzcD-associated flavoprotein CzcO